MSSSRILRFWRTYSPTGYHGTELANVSPGESVAVWGAGPVGLMATYSSIIRGAAEVYSIDHVQERLDKASEIGAIAINFDDGDPVQQNQRPTRGRRCGQDG